MVNVHRVSEELNGGLVELAERSGYDLKSEQGLMSKQQRQQWMERILQNAMHSSAGCLEKFNTLLADWQPIIARHFYLSLQRRLAVIFEVEPEISEYQQAPNIASFCHLLQFLATHPRLKSPSLTYNNKGIFSAIWIAHSKKRVQLEFLNHEQFRWTYIDASDGIDKAITGTGLVIPKMVLKVLEPYDAMDWMSN